MGNAAITKGVELAKSKGGTHFAIEEADKKSKFLTEKEVSKILTKILKDLPKINRITVTSCNLSVLPNQDLQHVSSLVTLSLEDNNLCKLPGKNPIAMGSNPLSLSSSNNAHQQLTFPPPPPFFTPADKNFFAEGVKYLVALKELYLVCCLSSVFSH